MNESQWRPFWNASKDAINSRAGPLPGLIRKRSWHSLMASGTRPGIWAKA